MRRRRQRAATPQGGKSAANKPAPRCKAPSAELADGSRAGNQAVERLVERSRQASAGEDAEARGAATDAAADAAAHLLEAEAATVHGHVVASREGPAPGSAAAARLLSHELQHVLQQCRARQLLPEVGEHAGQLEAAARAASRGGSAFARAGASVAVPAVQRQPTHGAEQKPEALPSRHPVVEERIRGYLQRVLEAQKGQSVQVTSEVKLDLGRLATGDLAATLRFDAFFAAIGPREPGPMAREITRLLPATYDAKKSAYLEGLPVAESKSAVQRGIDLVKKTEPYVSPEAQQAQWEFDRRAKELRRNEDTIGPFGLDLQRAWNIGRGLPEVIKPSPTRTAPAPIGDTTEAVIGTLDDAELVPKAERGSAQADEYAIASDVARDVARKFAEARKRKLGHIEVRLGNNYKSAEDRHEILDALERIVHRIAETLPNGGDPVAEVQVYFGELRIRRIQLRKGSP